MGGASGDRAGGGGEGGTGVTTPVPPAAVAVATPSAAAPKTAAETLLTTTSPNTASVVFRGQTQPYRTNLPQSSEAAAAAPGPVPAGLLYGDKTPGERGDSLG